MSKKKTAKKTTKKKTTKKAPIKEDFPNESEKVIESRILDWINRNGGFAFKVNTVGIWDEANQCYRNTGKFTLKGTSDILGIWKGKPLAIEVKNAVGQLSDDQKAFIQRYRREGAIAFKANSLESVVTVLEYFDKHGQLIYS